MKLGVGKLKWAPGAQAALLASAVAGGQEMLVAAATEAMVEAEKNAAPYQDTGQLHTHIHAVYPGESDQPTQGAKGVVAPIPGLHADNNEAFVVMHTHRDPSGDSERDRGDYAWYQENGPASKAEPGGRHHLLRAGEKIRGKYPGITVGPVTPGTSVGG